MKLGYQGSFVSEPVCGKLYVECIHAAEVAIWPVLSRPHPQDLQRADAFQSAAPSQSLDLGV
ncbi:hypothetical protein [Nitratidesulfovibrio vulgaris]|uniref:hypothetical protein n=1 Tax=Nitratidesulfovibrio vulgaris TaxID=881 RepID=UPI0005A21CFE|nr:hypothetical protein [Nitratidesulfovibrio vulgaris]WCB45059.1 hypothetical protein PH214_08110 [Nitratidesulfovibrio vulgaris]